MTIERLHAKFRLMCKCAFKRGFLFEDLWTNYGIQDWHDYIKLSDFYPVFYFLDVLISHAVTLSYLISSFHYSYWINKCQQTPTWEKLPKRSRPALQVVELSMDTNFSRSTVRADGLATELSGLSLFQG